MVVTPETEKGLVSSECSSVEILFSKYKGKNKNENIDEPLKGVKKKTNKRLINVVY